jgi:excisionase family DNA binding protein
MTTAVQREAPYRPDSQAQVSGKTWLLDAKVAATLLNVPESWIYAEARAERIPHVRLGRYVRFVETDLRMWVAAHSRGPVLRGKDGRPT